MLQLRGLSAKGSNLGRIPCLKDHVDSRRKISGLLSSKIVQIILTRKIKHHSWTISDIHSESKTICTTVLLCTTRTCITRCIFTRDANGGNGENGVCQPQSQRQIHQGVPLVDHHIAEILPNLQDFTGGSVDLDHEIGNHRGGSRLPSDGKSLGGPFSGSLGMPRYSMGQFESMHGSACDQRQHSQSIGWQIPL